MSEAVGFEPTTLCGLKSPLCCRYHNILMNGYGYAFQATKQLHRVLL